MRNAIIMFVCCCKSRDIYVSHQPGVRTGSFHTKEFVLRAPLGQWSRSHLLTVCLVGSHVATSFECFLVSVNCTVV